MGGSCGGGGGGGGPPAVGRLCECLSGSSGQGHVSVVSHLPLLQPKQFQPAHLPAAVTCLLVCKFPPCGAFLPLLPCACPAAVDATCCTRQSDLLEAGALLADAFDLARSGDERAVQANLTVVQVLEGVESSVLNAGDPGSGKLSAPLPLCTEQQQVPGNVCPST